MSTLNDILSAVVTDHQAAALTIGANALTIAKRKLPKQEEGVDAAYQVTVSGAEQVDRVTRVGFGGIFRVEYLVEMTLVIPNDRDQATNIDTVAAWRESTRARYQAVTHPLTVVSAVKAVDLTDNGVWLDRTDLADGYDYDQLVIRVTTYERRP